jgi:transcriptional regulator with XRE-family HTH domain
MIEQPAFGQRLRELRRERGLSQAALAGDVLSTGYLSRLESGERQPTARVVDHVAKVLGVPVSAFETASPTSSLANVLAVVTSSVPGADLTDALADALRSQAHSHPALRWQALWLLVRAKTDQGRLDEQYEPLIELVALSDELGVPELRVRTRALLSRCARERGDNAEARRHATEARALAIDVPLADQAAALHALVSAEAEAGLLAEAAAHADELCELTEPAQGALLTEALWAGATLRIRQGDYGAAHELLERALRLLDSHVDLMLWMRLRLAAASLYLQVDPPLIDEARTRLDEIMVMLELVGTDLHKQQLLTLRAHLAFADGRMDDARELCGMVDEQTLLLSFRDRVRFQALRGQLLVIDGQVAAGTRVLQELARQAEDARNVELAAEIWRNLARLLTDAYGKDNHDAVNQH